METSARGDAKTQSMRRQQELNPFISIQINMNGGNKNMHPCGAKKRFRDHSPRDPEGGSKNQQRDGPQLRRQGRGVTPRRSAPDCEECSEWDADHPVAENDHWGADAPC